MANRLASKVSYKHTTFFDESLRAVHMRKIHLKFDKQVYLGMTILDLSKIIMYNFYYNYI